MRGHEGAEATATDGANASARHLCPSAPRSVLPARDRHFALSKHPTLDEQHIEPLEAAYGELPSLDEHDGLVSFASQLWGDLVAAVTVDHLDIVGHFGNPEQGTTDWLPAGTGFSADAFRSVWLKIVDYQLAATQPLKAKDAATRTG